MQYSDGSVESGSDLLEHIVIVPIEDTEYHCIITLLHIDQGYIHGILIYRFVLMILGIFQVYWHWLWMQSGRERQTITVLQLVCIRYVSISFIHVHLYNFAFVITFFCIISILTVSTETPPQALSFKSCYVTQGWPVQCPV